jgi:hypothetical protein
MHGFYTVDSDGRVRALAVSNAKVVNELDSRTPIQQNLRENYLAKYWQMLVPNYGPLEVAREVSENTFKDVSIELKGNQ